MSNLVRSFLVALVLPVAASAIAVAGTGPSGGSSSSSSQGSGSTSAGGSGDTDLGGFSECAKKCADEKDACVAEADRVMQAAFDGRVGDSPTDGEILSVYLADVSSCSAAALSCTVGCLPKLPKPWIVEVQTAITQ